MPVLTMYRFGNYFTSFLIGYYIFSHEKAQEIIEKICIPMLCLAVIGAVLYALHYHCNFSAIGDYLIALIVEIIMTFALYEVIKRIPVVRYFVLGVNGKRD